MRSEPLNCQQDVTPVLLGADLPLRERPAVLISASSINARLHAAHVAAAIAEGVRAALPSARVMQMPGSATTQGFVEEIVALAGGRIEPVWLTGLQGGNAVRQLGVIGFAGDLTAVISAAASDEQSRDTGYLDSSCASSRGTGQLIRVALDRGVKRIIIDCGEGGVCDGGIGMANALGIRFMDAQRSEIAQAGGLLRLAVLDMSLRDPRLDKVSIEAVVDPGCDLIGPQGIARLDGDRSGASQPQILRLERGLIRYAQVVKDSLGIDVASLPGGGACGGLAAGLVAFAGARLTSRSAFLRSATALQSCIAVADLVIVVEDPADPPDGGGRAAVDPQPYAAPDRVPQWVARQARAQGLPVIVLNGNTLSSAAEPGTADDAACATDAFPVLSMLSTAGWSAGQPLVDIGNRIREVSVRSLRDLLRGWTRVAGST